jgi:hypothetical protein
VDSNSDNKEYFKELEKYDVIIEDVNNTHWMVGAYWHVYKKYMEEDFYYFMHDSMIVKGNLDYLKEKDLTTLMYFERKNVGGFNDWGKRITEESKYKYNYDGYGCYGPIFFCKNKVMARMLEMGADKFLPSNKVETGPCEGCYGFFLEEQGYDLKKCSLYGNVFYNEGPNGPSGPPPHKTSWEFPVEKFYASHVDSKRL